MAESDESLAAAAAAKVEAEAEVAPAVEVEAVVVAEEPILARASGRRLLEAI